MAQLQLSTNTGVQASKAEHRPLTGAWLGGVFPAPFIDGGSRIPFCHTHAPHTELLGQGLQTAFLRQCEPLLPHMIAEGEVLEAKTLHTNACATLHQLEARLARAKMDGIAIVRLERTVQQEQRFVDAFKKRYAACVKALEAQRQSTPAEALALLDPLPPPPSPSPVAPPSTPSHDDEHAQQRQRLREEWEQQQVQGGDTAARAVLALTDALSVILSFSGSGRVPMALASVCRTARRLVLDALTHATISYQHLAKPPPP